MDLSPPFQLRTWWTIGARIEDGKLTGSASAWNGSALHRMAFCIECEARQSMGLHQDNYCMMTAATTVMSQHELHFCIAFLNRMLCLSRLPSSAPPVTSYTPAMRGFLGGQNYASDMCDGKLPLYDTMETSQHREKSAARTSTIATTAMTASIVLGQANTQQAAVKCTSIDLLPLAWLQQLNRAGATTVGDRLRCQHSRQSCMPPWR